MDMARIAGPLQQLTKKDKSFFWSAECDAAFRLLKEKLTTAPLLRRPDFNHPFILQTDWQPAGMGAILSQEIDGIEHVIAYAIKSLNVHKQHYAPTEGELLAVMWAIRHFYCYLHGNFFILETDHKALTYLLTSKNLSTKLTRYAMELQEYDFELRYRPGIAHANVDALYRLPQSAPELDLPHDNSPPASSLDHMHKRGTIDLDNHDITATPPSVFMLRSTPLGVDPNLDRGEETPDSPEQKVIYLSTPPEIVDLTTSHEPGQGIDEEDVWPPTDDGPPIEEDTACRNCGTQDAPERMLICDQCSEGYHMECLDLPLDIIPSGKWHCTACDATGLKNMAPRTSTVDITQDLDVLCYLESRTYNPEAICSRQDKQRIYSRAQNYILKDGKLFVRPNARYHWPRIVPSIDERPKIIAQCHDEIGHFGIVRTCSVLQNRFYWPNITHDVRDYINNCATCATKKASFLLPDELQSFPVSARFDRLHIDLMGPFPETPKGNKYITCCIDAFTKWAEACPVPNKEAHTVANFFLANIISRHGVPQTVVSDNGREFDGEFTKVLEDSYIEHRHSSPNHPQTNGLVERFNQTLRRAIQRSIQDNQADWDLHVDKVLFGYRIGIQASTAYSPFELLYGRPATLPIQNSYRPTDYIDIGTSGNDTAEPARQLLEKSAPFNEVFEKASMNLQRAQDRQQRDFQKRHLPRNRPLEECATEATFKLPRIKEEEECPLSGAPGPSREELPETSTLRLQPGAFVMIKNPHKKNKLDSDLLGPYRFVKYTNDTHTVAILQSKSNKGWKENVLKISLFSLNIYRRNDASQQQPQ